MKANEWRKLDMTDLQAKVNSIGEELFKLKFRNSYRRLENTAKIKQLRRDVARIKTIIQQKQQ